MNVVVWNTAVNEVKAAGFSYTGQCMCTARIHKFKKNNLQIKMHRNGGFAYLYINNINIKIEKVENVQKIIEKAIQAEAEFPVRKPR